MKLGFLFVSAVTAWRGVKEHILIEQFLRTGEVTLVDDDRKNGKITSQSCGDKPNKPDNAHSIQCQGKFCATVCKQGYRSMGEWRAKCVKKKKQYAWSPSKLTACQSCKSYLNKVHSSVQHQKSYYKNLPVHEFFCKNDEVLHFGGDTYKNGKIKKVKCRCKRQGNGKKDSKKHKYCKWVAEGETFRDNDFASVRCTKKGG